MAGLVYEQFASARKHDRRDASPGLLHHIPSRLDAMRLQLGERGVDVRAHQVELVPPVLARVKSDLSRRKRKDRPSAAGVYRLQAEHVAEEGSVGVGVGGFDDG